MPQHGNPSPYNVVVLGAGTAGLVTAAGTAGLGGRVAVVERGRMGGDCLNTGCVPSKALIASARLVDRMRHAKNWGLVPSTPVVNYEPIAARMRSKRERLAGNDSQERFEGLGVDVYRGEARFVSAREVRVGETSLRATNFVIATGSRPAIPEIPGLDSVRFYTNESIFDELDVVPRRLAILGGGPIGCELGQAFARFGARVTILQRAPQILEKEDADVAGVVRRQFEAEGIEVLAGTDVQRVRAEGSSIVLELAGSARKTVTADALLIAAGRAPNIEELDLAAAGVAFTNRGVTVNAQLQTSRPHIYAAGDVAGSLQFTHVADHHARVVVRNILFPWVRIRARMATVPWCTFTSPEVARVGLNEDEARAKGIAYDVYVQPFEEVDRAVLESQETGFLKVLTKKGSDRILGVSLVGERAGDLIAEFVLAIGGGIGLKRIAATIHAYPTYAEVAKKLADRQQKNRLTPAAARIFAWLYRRRLQ